MKLGQFIKWQVRKWLPLFLVILLISASISWIDALTRSYHYMHGTPEYLRYFAPGTMSITVQFIFVAFILPFFVFDYRNSKTAADTYNALPLAKNTLKITKILIGGVFIAAAFTFVYWVEFMLTLYMYNSTPSVYGNAYRVVINFIGYIPAYFYILLGTLSTYFFSCTLTSLGNNFIGSFTYSFFGNLTVCLIFNAVLNYFAEFSNTYNPTMGNLIETSGFGFASDIHMVNQVLSRVISKKTLDPSKFLIFDVIISLALRLGIGAFAFTDREPSGEYFGKPGARKEGHKAIIYAGLATFLTLIASTFKYAALDLILEIILSVAGIYLTLVIFNKTFKLKRTDVIALAMLIVVFLILSFAMTASGIVA